MKKGVVLLITLFFITAISLLVLKNLDDTDIFLKKQNYILNNTQVILAIKNTQEELSRLLKENKDYVNEALENDIFKFPIPIGFNDLDIDFTIEKYDRVDINDIKKKDSKTIQNLFYENDLYNYEEFEDIYKEKLQESILQIGTTKQVDDIINTFILRSENNKIDSFSNKIGFLSEKNLYEINIYIKYLSSSAKAYYILKNDGKVLYFDISFK